MRMLAVNAVVALIMPVSAPVSWSETAPERAADLAAERRDGLTEAVAAALPERPGAPETQVNVQRQADGWAFGSAVHLAPAGAEAYPEGWLWVARDDGGWRVALEGTAQFPALSAAAPVLRPREQETLRGLDPAARGTDPADPGAVPDARSGGTDYRTQMRLPYQVGQAWRYTGGPHPMSGNTWSSIDLAGGDGRVRAARDGVVYRMCGSGTGWLRVVHADGFATDYYHLEGRIPAGGTRVAEGDFLGRIGVDVSCGGSATGPHVHFSLRRGGDYVPIDRYAFGRWSIRAGARAYDGFALHGSTRVGVGGVLRNYGVLGRTQGVVDTNGGGVLNRRAGPGTNHRVVGTIADGATVRVECSQRGTSHTGRNSYTTDLWNRLAGGGWVSDAYLWTGTGDPVAGWC